MDNSLKIGIISGLVAGIVGGIIAFFLAVYHIEIGLLDFGLENLSIIPIKEIAIVEIPFYIITGIVLGIIFSKVYDLIPGKGIVKGFIAGLVLYLIFGIRWYTYGIMFSLPTAVLNYIVIYVPMGLVLGISYEILNKRYVSKQEKFTTITYNLKGVFYPGAIAAIVSGVPSYLAVWIIYDPLIWQRFTTNIGFLMMVLGIFVIFYMTWGIVFGTLYAMFYDKIPKSGILKGLIFAMAIYFFTNLPNTIHELMYYQVLTLEYEVLVRGILSLLTGLFAFVPFGLVLGWLYRKPSD